jgi:hypothetical protein
MSATRSEGVDGEAGELDRVSELACDEALFGLHPALARELDAAAGASQLRGQLALVTSGLAMREVTQREELPASVRRLVQAQAFDFFERQGSAPAPTATTTGANVVELGSASVVSRRPGNRWLGVLAVAACFAAITVSVRWQLSREPASASGPAAPVAGEPLLAVPLHASRLGATAELAQSASGRELSFSLSGVADRQLPADTWLWIRARQAAGPAWQRVGLIQANSEGTARLVFDPGEVQRVLGFAVAAPRQGDPALPDLEHAQLEASVGD